MATVNPWVMRKDSILTLTIDPDGVPSQVTTPCEYVRGIAVESTPTETDASTMCATRTLVGNPTHACVFAIVWSPEFWDAFEPHVGKEIEVYYQADGNMAAGRGWKFRARYSYVPMGSSQLGDAIQSDWSWSVLTDPTLAAAS